MDRKFLVVLMAGNLIAVVSASAFTEDMGRVEFSGRIITNTCAIDVDDAGADTVVTLADVYLDNFDDDGTPDPTKDFQISLAKCDPVIASLSLRFSGDTTDGENLRLKNDLSDVSTAANVDITVTNNDGGNTDVVFDDSVPVSTTDMVNTGDEATPSIFNYTTRVIQTSDGESTAGKYHTSTNSTVLYR